MLRVKKEAPLATERLWCRKCGFPAMLDLTGSFLSCQNSCALESDIGFMSGAERREWLASKVLEHNDLFSENRGA